MKRNPPPSTASHIVACRALFMGTRLQTTGEASPEAIREGFMLAALLAASTQMTRTEAAQWLRGISHSLSSPTAKEFTWPHPSIRKLFP